MIIAIDGYEANVINRVGIGRYAYEILKHMYQNFQTPNEIQFRVYLPNSPLPDMPPETDWWQYRVVRLSKFWTFVGLPVSLWLDRPHADVVFLRRIMYHGLFLFPV